MSGVNGITGSKPATATQDLGKAKAMGRDEFFKMLIAQLKNQDPLNPQQGTEFAAQLAQFASLEQLTSLNSALTSQSRSNNDLIHMQSINLMGKEITARRMDGDEETTITGQVTAINFKNKAIILTVNGQDILFGDVLSVKSVS